ncbi:hypothetical protein IQ288_04810 [Burkholderia sp. R-69980]|nr:hypothetical protein [Burkholderia sp. R-69980]
MTVLFYSADDAWPNILCDVRISNGSIRVEYEEDGRRVWYAGAEDGDGHFTLTAAHVDGTATLHRSPSEPDLLEGSWVEGGCKGMWCIELSEQEE